MTLSTELARLAEAATPGEWVVSYGADERQGMGVATDIRIRDIHPEFGSMIALLHNPGVPEAEANAQLIATMCSESARKQILTALRAQQHAEALAEALEKIERRTRQHSDDDANDDRRDKHHANAYARAALAAYRSVKP